MAFLFMLAAFGLFESGLCSAVSHANSGTPLTQGQDLRLVELHETTTWPFLVDCYRSHNGYRENHGVSSLRLNRTLVDYARLKALILAWYDGDAPREKDPNMFGENQAWTRGAEGPVNCTEVTNNWYRSEEPSWDYDASTLDDSNRHFAQIVWRGTRRFGCGQALSRGARGGVYTVCYYEPTAEVGGERENVLRPTPKPTTTTAAPES